MVGLKMGASCVKDDASAGKTTINKLFSVWKSIIYVCK